MASKRTVEWGHWGITFWRDAGGRYWGDPGVMVASLFFPVGVRGPMDNLPGQKQQFMDACSAWAERGELAARAIPAEPIFKSLTA